MVEHEIGDEPASSTLERKVAVLAAQDNDRQAGVAAVR
jgi:hypothetical protein